MDKSPQPSTTLADEAIPLSRNGKGTHAAFEDTNHYSENSPITQQPVNTEEYIKEDKPPSPNRKVVYIDEGCKEKAYGTLG